MNELQPLFDKFTQYFDEILISSDLSTSGISIFSALNPANIDMPILKENLLLSNTVYSYFFKTNKKHIPIVNEICKLIGNSPALYQLTVKTLTELFIKTHNWLYATLKSLIINKFHETLSHENLINLIGNSDMPTELILKFGNLIHVCLKERKIEAKRAKELEMIMESKKFEKILM